MLGGSIGGSRKQTQEDQDSQTKDCAVPQAAACVVFVPVDVIKERLQVQKSGLPASSGSLGSTPPSYAGSLDALRVISRTEGLFGLYKGYYATLASFGPFSALYFAFYEQARKAVAACAGKPDPKSLPPALTLLASASAGTAASVVTCPLDLAKLRLQTQLRLPPGVEIPDGHLRGLRDAMLRLWREGGVRALFRGAGARAAFHAPSTCITFTTFEELVLLHVAYNIRRRQGSKGREEPAAMSRETIRLAALAAACYAACVFPRAFVSPETQRPELTQSQGFVRSDRQVVMQADTRPSLQPSSESASFGMLGRASAAALCALVAVSADRRSRQRA
eukprot:s1076_g8.t1